MQKTHTLLALLALTATACSPGGGSSSTGTAQGGGLSANECRAMVDKSRELSGMPSHVFVEESAQMVQQCDASTSVSRANYNCAMAAGSIEDFRACRIDVIN